MNRYALRHRKWTFLSLLIITPVGFYTKFYAGPAAGWVNNSLSGVFYEIFWCIFILLFCPNGKPLIISAAVLMATCILEFLQLWHHPVLEWIRGYFIGQVLLGTSFAGSDFPYYVLGCGIGWWWTTLLVRKKNSPAEARL